MYRCPRCQICVWSHYADDEDLLSFIRVGTLDFPDRCPPNIHIYTSTKQKFVAFDGTIPVIEENYDREKFWPADSLARRKRVMQELGALETA